MSDPLHWRYQIRDEWGKDTRRQSWAETLEDVYMLLRKRVVSETGLHLKSPTYEPPSWCEHHDHNGELKDPEAWKLAQGRHMREQRCDPEAIRTVEAFDNWLYGKAA